MSNTSIPSSVDRHPVVYAGRFIDQVKEAYFPEDYIILGEQKAFSHELMETLNRANALVLLDLFSFPFGTMSDEYWSIPIIVVLPSNVDARSLIAKLGTTLFKRLGFFDRIIASDSALWKELRRKYRWAEGQRVPAPSDNLGKITSLVCALLKVEHISSAALSRGKYGADWHRSGDLCSDKALHRLQAAALEPRFVAAGEERGPEVSLDVLEVGTGVGRWAASFEWGSTRFTGIDTREELIRIACYNFPEGRFDYLDSSLLFPYEKESFDLVFSVATLHHKCVRAKRTLLSEMWRVCRPGGRLLFLENFVFTAQSETASVYPMSIVEFEDLILGATARQVVLEYVESLRYPNEDLHRGGVISLLRLGVPQPQ
jgi:SAM-dependent methyltransferase